MSTVRVELEQGVVIGRAGERELHADVFRAPASEVPTPGILLVHGGAWKVGDPTQLRGYGFLVGREGFTCVATEYRLSGEAAWPAALHDVKTAIRWMRANAAQLAIDPDRIVIFGASSGAHLSLMAAMAAGEFEGDGGHGEVSSAVQGVVSLYGITRMDDCPKLADAVAAFLAGGGDAAIAESSPALRVRSALPPMLLFHSNRDELVPRRQTFELYEAMLGAGNVAELATFDGNPHAFDVDPRLGRMVATMTASFVRRHVMAQA